MSCCQKPADAAPASSCATTSSCATEGGKCCPIAAKIQCLGQCAGPLVLRLTLAVAMFPHGAQKVLGIWGGDGWSKTYENFTVNYFHMPAPVAVVGILAEFVFPIMLVLGLFTRVAALGLAIQMATAAVMAGHIYNGFFSNWHGEMANGRPVIGYEYHLLYGGAALALVFIGPGKVAIDSVICCILGKKKGCCTK